MTLKATVSMGWVNTVIAAAQRQGVEPDVLLTAAGIPVGALDWERWPIDYITRLWRASERCTGDPGFGLRVGAGVSPAGISGVGFALQSAATLREAIGMVQKFQRLISDGGRFQMLAGQTATWVVYHPQQGQLAFSPYQIEAVLAAVVRLAGWVTGSALQPLRVQFSQARLAPLQDYHDAFGCPVEFEQAFSGLLVDNAMLDQPLPQADPQLAQVHEHYTAARLAALGINSVSAPDVRQWLAAHMGPQVPRRAQAAQALGVSERTLARRLGEQGQTFDRLLDDVRRELALQAVADPERTLADIAQSLGFAEASTFYRAFHRWTGMPPARWRRQRVM
ncbi:MAG TPA: AraC family transcriptional regulator [Moraxellaceae bacterium]|nr:AraC family transcriptional regulator [Moraxellaceae bacterium]